MLLSDKFNFDFSFSLKIWFTFDFRRQAWVATPPRIDLSEAPYKDQFFKSSASWSTSPNRDVSPSGLSCFHYQMFEVLLLCFGDIAWYIVLITNVTFIYKGVVLYWFMFGALWFIFYYCHIEYVLITPAYFLFLQGLIIYDPVSH